MNGIFIGLGIFAIIVGIIIYLWQKGEPEELIGICLGEYWSHERAIAEAALAFIFGVIFLIIGVVM